MLDRKEGIEGMPNKTRILHLPGKEGNGRERGQWKGTDASPGERS